MVPVKVSPSLIFLIFSRLNIRFGQFFSLLCVVWGATLSVEVLAHSEREKPRYVAEDGVDEGRCEFVSAPCKTIAYAVEKSNKGDHVRVAEGIYFIDDADTLFYLLSDIVPVRGAYSEKNNFMKSQPQNFTRLLGVPLEYAGLLTEKGFTVIVDQKGRNNDVEQEILVKMDVYKKLSKAKSDVECSDGAAGDHACSNMDLLSHVPLTSFDIAPSRANDIWGHYDLNDNKEYAIIGLHNGVGVVEVTDPENPRVVGSLPSPQTTWRDIKVYQYYDLATERWKSYAYVSADGLSVGLMIVDLSSLPDSISVAATDRSDVYAHNVYLSNVDYSTGVTLTGLHPYLHLTGSNNQRGAYNSYALTDPVAPVSVYRFSGTAPLRNYTHDASSMVIDDDRKDTQCVNGNSICEVFFDFHEDNFQIWDKTVNAEPVRLSTTEYQNVEYVHSGWYTEDKNVLVIHDELDEERVGLNTTVRFFDVSDLSAPSLLSTWTGPTKAIDHNGFVRGNRYYMSNYARGVTVLDISDPSAPVEAGYFDTYPLSDSTSFNGAWGVYPFLPSGNILVSDVNSGLYVVRDNTLSPSEGNLRFDATNYDTTEGSTITLNIMRSAGATGTAQVQWELQSGSASGEDYSLTSGEGSSGTLNWSDGDVEQKSIDISIQSDTIKEGAELFFIRLFNPENNVALSQPNLATITIAASDGNAAPIANAGSTIATEAGESVSLSANATDEEGDSVSFLWEQISGASVTLTNADTAEASFTAPSSATTLVFKVTATDGGASSHDFVSVTVFEPAVVTPTPSPSTPTTSSGGGGGGSLGLAWLLMMFLSWHYVFFYRVVREKHHK